jgi:hypothetical protein
VTALRFERADRRRLTAAFVVTLIALPAIVKANRDSPSTSGAAVVAPNNAADAAAREIVGSRTSASIPATPSTALASSDLVPRNPERPQVTATTAVPSNGVPTGHDRFEDGLATFHEFDDAVYGPRSCAHRTLPLDTTITITNTDTGRSTWCVVRGTGPASNERLIDLDAEVFAELADLTDGAAPVRITW